MRNSISRELRNSISTKLGSHGPFLWDTAFLGASCRASAEFPFLWLQLSTRQTELFRPFLPAQGWKHNSPGCLPTLTLVPVPAVELGGVLLLQMPSFRQKQWVCAHRRCCCVICCPNVTVALPSSNPGDVTALSVFLYPSLFAVFNCELLKTSCWISAVSQEGTNPFLCRAWHQNY